MDLNLIEKYLNILGTFYSKQKTIFVLLAPIHSKMSLVLEDHVYEMEKTKEIFSITVYGDYELARYYYLDENNEKILDPFSYYNDQEYSYVLDSNKFIKESIKTKENKNYLIYETNVRDFSSDPSVPFKYPKKFLAFSEDNLFYKNELVGLAYLKTLGISHLQFMPILDFDLDHSDYNWGYNPTNYNFVYRGYVYEQDNPYAYLNEFRKVTNILHKNEIKVTLDVVFNHVYNRDHFILRKLFGPSIFRYKENGEYGQGTYCGNEINSQDDYVRIYLLFIVKRLVELFDIDGLRFDLMGILDIETINLIKEYCLKKKPDFLIYGEGWNMGDVLSNDQRACLDNAPKLENIKMFNDYFRETIVKYLQDDLSVVEDVKNVLIGKHKYLKNEDSINYVECHDNYTFYDRLVKDKVESKTKKSKLALGLVLLAKGLSFIQNGEEFLRTKKGVENSYNSGDEINFIDWDLMIQNKEVVEYFKELVYFKKQHPELNSLDSNCYFEEYYECLIYHVNDLMFIINPSCWDHIYHHDNEFKVLNNVDEVINNHCHDLKVEAYSLIICQK